MRRITEKGQMLLKEWDELYRRHKEEIEDSRSGGLHVLADDYPYVHNATDYAGYCLLAYGTLALSVAEDEWLTDANGDRSYLIYRYPPIAITLGDLIDVLKQCIEEEE